MIDYQQLIDEWNHARRRAARWKRRADRLERRLQEARDAIRADEKERRAAIEAETLDRIAELLLG